MNNDIDRVESALTYITSYDDRDAWVKMAMAVKSLVGEAGFDAWDRWSQQAESYTAKAAMSTWKSVTGNGAVTAGTFFHEALANGWREDVTYPKQTPEQRAARRRETADRAVKDAAAKASQRAEAATKAATIWQCAKDAPSDHVYLVEKGIRPHGAKVLRGELVIPLRDGDEIFSLQFIAGSGDKKFLPGGRVAGCYFMIGEPDQVLCIGEGFSTSATIAEVTGYAATVAFSAGNLLSVAKSMRQRYPDVKIIVCCDNDYRTEGNPGLMKATEAALAVGGLLAVPDFGTIRPDGDTDFNDMAAHYGAEAVGRAIENAKAPVRVEHATCASIAYQRVSDITPRPIRWLWKGRIARGKVTLLAGNPGLGKSQITASMAAIVSKGGAWPVDRSACERGNTIILSAEDDPEDTIRPRLEAAGADLTRVFILEAVIEHHASGQQAHRAFNLKTDLAKLGALLAEIGDVALVVIDPISAYLGDADSHVNAEVRALLSPLGEMAARHGAAVVCVSHLNKASNGEALLRVTGSLAFVAAARAAFVVTKDAENASRRLLLPIKNNIGNDQSGLAFAVQSAQVKSAAGVIETSCVMWEAEAVTITADEAMTTANDPEERTELVDAKAFLAGLLADGKMPAKRVYGEGREAGYSERTIRRAQKALCIEAEKDGMKGPWYWTLPPKTAKDSEGGLTNSVDAFDASWPSS